jgi:hypothetical protein
MMEISKNLHKRGLRERRPKRRVYQEEAKTRQTSHWDWDYLPLSTLERLARREKSASKDAHTGPERSRRIKLALACIVSGTLLMAALLSFILIDLRSV